MIVGGHARTRRELSSQGEARPAQDADFGKVSRVKNTLRGFAGAPAPAETVTIDFEGEPVAAFAGEPVAVALFAAGVRTLGRSTKYHRPRGLFCLDGHCASCYMRIDGRPNQRACMTPARDGLSLRAAERVPQRRRRPAGGGRLAVSATGWTTTR